MKFFEYKNDRDDSYLIFLGIQIFKKRIIRQNIWFSILSGIFSYYRFKPFERSLSILGVPILKYFNVPINGQVNKSLEFITFTDYKKLVREEISASILEQIDRSYENIVYFRAGIGEIFLLNLYIKEFLLSKNIKASNTCFVGLRTEFNDLFTLYNPNIDYKKVANIDLNKIMYSFIGDGFIFNDTKFIIYPNYDIIAKFIEDCKSGISKDNFFKLILDYYSISQTSTPISINFNSDIEKQVITKLSSVDLSFNKFIIFAPEANTLELLPENFWNKLEKIFINKGYDVFWNLTRMKLQNKKSLHLNLKEAFFLGQKAKGIIGLSSGFLETLLLCDCKVHVLYTKYLINGICAENVLKTHSKKEFPFVNPENIYEYVYKKEDEEKIINAIVDSF